jgi:hypothetical protein
MKLPVYVYAEKNTYDGRVTYRALSWKSETLWGTMFCETEIDFPEANMAEVINGQVKVLRIQQQQIRAKCEVEVQKIEQQIGELLAIEDKSGVAE